MGPQSDALIAPVSLPLIRGADLGLKGRHVQGKPGGVYFWPRGESALLSGTAISMFKHQ